MLTPAQHTAALQSIVTAIPHSSTALNGFMAADIITSAGPGWVNLCSKLAPWAAIAVCAAPLPTLQQVEREKDTGNLPLLPYSSMVVNAFVWTVYGLLIREKKVWLTNAIGASMGLYYCQKFSKFVKPTANNLPGTLSNHLFGASFIMLLTSAIGSMLPVKTASSIVGTMGVLFCVLLFASPLSALKDVIATKSAKSIPLPFSLVACINTVMWSVVGWFEMNDFMIYAPNLLGLSCSLMQVALKLVYGNGTRKQKQDEVNLAMTAPRGGGYNLPV